MLEDVYSMVEEEMKKTLDKMKKEFAKIRTGRASPALLDGVKVVYYGVPTPLNQTATISVPEPNLIVIQPWDLSIIADIEKAIQKANLDVTPMNDGKLIRIPIPPLTEETRKEIVKNIKKLAEDYRVSVRNHRRDGIEMAKEMEKNKEISEDDLFRAKDKIQGITDEYIKSIDELLDKKIEEIMKI